MIIEHRDAAPGLVYVELNQTDSARAAYARATAALPHATAGLQMRFERHTIEGEILHGSGDLDGALAELHAALDSEVVKRNGVELEREMWHLVGGILASRQDPACIEALAKAKTSVLSPSSK